MPTVCRSIERWLIARTQERYEDDDTTANVPTSIIVKGIISSKPKLYPSFVFFDIRDDTKNLSFTLYGFIGNYRNIERKLKATGVVDEIKKERKES